MFPAQLLLRICSLCLCSSCNVAGCVPEGVALFCQLYLCTLTLSIPANMIAISELLSTLGVNFMHSSLNEFLNNWPNSSTSYLVRTSVDVHSFVWDRYSYRFIESFFVCSYLSQIVLVPSKCYLSFMEIHIEQHFIKLRLQTPILLYTIVVMLKIEAWLIPPILWTLCQHLHS